jgi:hypothetical protein
MRPILTGKARHHQTQNLSDQHPEPVIEFRGLG